MEVFNLHALKSNPWKITNYSEEGAEAGANITATEDGYVIQFHQISEVLKKEDS